MPESYDVIIIGGGVVGCMTARFLSRYQLDILRKVTFQAPVRMNQIVLENALGTGIDVIASRDLE